jgi:hypothetical protein
MSPPFLQGFAPHPTKGLKTLWNPMLGYHVNHYSARFTPTVTYGDTSPTPPYRELRGGKDKVKNPHYPLKTQAWVA